MIAQKRWNGMSKRIRNEEPARPPVDVAKFLAAQRDDGRIDDGQHFLDVVEEQTIEEDFVGVLQLAKIDVAFEVVRLEGKSLMSAEALIVERFDDGRKKAVQVEGFALLVCKGGSLVERRIVEQVHAA